MNLLRVVAVAALAASAPAQVSFDRLRNAAREPQNWLTYNGSYASTHHSTLAQIREDNVRRLELKWVWQANSLEKIESAPLLVDGVMYLSDPPNDVVAIDARTGRVFWRYRHPLPPDVVPCCGRINRGLAILGDTLYMGTLDAHLIALDAGSGRKRWEVRVADHRESYSLTMAPLAIGDKIVVGTAGGELGIRGFIAAYDAKTGREVWRFKTIPEPGEPGHDTWAGDSWKHGSGSLWLTGSYDPELNLTYWGIGNPGPDWNPSMRRGDNLYTDSVVALDADTGKLKWHFQFTPNDGLDFDSAQIPVLADLTWRGRARKAMLWGNRNGFFYVLDRSTGEFLLGKPFVKQTWASGLDDHGRPIKIPERTPSAEGTLIYPGVQGGTNWYAPSFSPRTGLFYLTAWDDYSGVYYSWNQEYEQGKWYAGGSVRAELPSIVRQEVRTRGPESGYGAIRAMSPVTGERVWEYRMSDVSDSGLLTTATDLLFSGNREGHFFALNARDGKLLWTRYLGGQVAASPITWSVDGRQYVSIASGHALFTFGLPEE
jgi:alcohol dehydrogenase (cytochrome c)